MKMKSPKQSERKENPNKEYVPPGVKTTLLKDLNDFGYYRASVSNWVFEWNGGEEKIDRVTQEAIIRYPNGGAKIVLNNASISNELYMALQHGALNEVKLKHYFMAIPVENTSEKIPMCEIFERVSVKRIAEILKAQSVAQMVIYAEKSIN